MKYFHTLFLTAFMISSCGADSNGYQLVWSDEFDYKGLPDPAKWGYEVGYIRNNEAQYYTEKRTENARVENGNLINHFT